MTTPQLRMSTERALSGGAQSAASANVFKSDSEAALNPTASLMNSILYWLVWCVLLAFVLVSVVVPEAILRAQKWSYRKSRRRYSDWDQRINENNTENTPANRRLVRLPGFAFLGIILWIAGKRPTDSLDRSPMISVRALVLILLVIAALVIFARMTRGPRA